MKKCLASLVLLPALLAPSAWSQQPQPGQSPTPTESVKKFSLPKKPHSNIIELEPIQGNLKDPLKKYGPGWRSNPIVGIPGLSTNADASDPYYGRAAGPGVHP